VVGMRIRQNFFQLNESADYWWPQLGDKTPAGGHAMVVIGYDHRRGAFKLMNSWGTEWGQQGFIWIKYQVMAKFCKYAYIFQVDKELDEFWSDGQSQRDEVTKINNYPLQEMGAKLSLLFNPYKSIYCGSFTAATLNRQGLMYTTQKETWDIGQQFQLRIENTSEPVYLYIFSQNPKGRISLHWPRPESFQDGQPEAIRTRDDEDIVIPGPQRVMRISQYGTNYLVMLLSKRPLGNPIQLLRPLENSGDLLPQKLYALLASNMIPAADLHLSDHNMELQVQTRSIRSMVPLVLRIDAKPPNHITKSSN
ncbi:MAG: hypothetical protein HRU40_07240, partial [Saprospiraceae bacterium]|nr:hypothetical protein [Saprospiraceae bacterium]